jgi:hypothetical protein
MISLFRKIRQSLLQQNKVTQYLAYAIGEIFLVVIGILIALQINSWNELRKIRQYEVKMSEKIFENLSTSEEVENNLVEALTERVIVSIEDREKSIQNRFTDPKAIYSDKFLHLIQLQKRNTAVTKSRLEGLIPPMDELITLLEAELKIPE